MIVAHPLFAQRATVQYLNAAEVLSVAKASGKPYTWVAIYVPKCARAAELFSERMVLYKPHQDKAQLIMLSILASNDNADSVAKFSAIHSFETPLYTMDTMYTKGDIRETPDKFMKDLNALLGVDHERFQHIIINKQGKLVYRTDDDMNAKQLKKVLK